MFNISELVEPPIIGETYLVPCYRVFHGKTLRYYDLPVIGPAHADPELGNFAWHLHLDVRFCTDEEILNFSEVKDLKNIENNGGSQNRDIPVTLAVEKFVKTIDKAKVCLRECLDLRSYKSSDDWTLNFHVPNEQLNSVMEDNCKDFVLNLDCKVCPHRGLPLNSVPVYDEVITCPGHGLQFSSTTGKLIRRTGPKARHSYKIGKEKGLKFLNGD